MCACARVLCSFEENGASSVPRLAGFDEERTEQQHRAPQKNGCDHSVQCSWTAVHNTVRMTHGVSKHIMLCYVEVKEEEGVEVRDQRVEAGVGESVSAASASSPALLPIATSAPAAASPQAPAPAPRPSAPPSLKRRVDCSAGGSAAESSGQRWDAGGDGGEAARKMQRLDQGRQVRVVVQANGGGGGKTSGGGGAEEPSSSSSSRGHSGSSGSSSGGCSNVRFAVSAVSVPSTAHCSAELDLGSPHCIGGLSVRAVVVKRWVHTRGRNEEELI